MATSTMVPIATQTLGSAAASITFSSIPGTYTDLRLVLTGTSDSSGGIAIQFNSDTAPNYSFTVLYGNGTSAGSANATSTAQLQADYAGASSTTITEMWTADIFSYAGSTYKTSILNGVGDLNGSGAVEAIVGLWRSTAAITSIKITVGGGNLKTGTIATLWGI